jgi:S1-C subfamily serine protease
MGVDGGERWPLPAPAGDVRGRRRGLTLAIALLVLLPTSAAAQPCAEPLAVLFERVSPAVVSIQAMKINKSKPSRRFETVGGSGVIIEKDGHVLTNAHVVDGAAALSVTLDHGVKASARIVGLDPVLDVALIRVDGPHPLPVARLGDSSTVRVGDEVIAIGNPIGLDQTMTRGIVSGLNRTIPGISDEPMIQTDAPINPGNSGGPLVDRCGQVIGLNTLISEDAQSIGFAVPINAARAVLRELREAGRVVRPWIGLQGRAIDAGLGSIVRMPVTPGYLVEVVFDGSPADQGGVRGGNLAIIVQGEEYLLGGDILTAIQGTPIRTHQDYVAKVRTLKPGQRVKLTLMRDGHARDVMLTVGERPRLPTDLAE